MYLASRYADIYQQSYITRDMDAALAHCETALGLTGFNISEPVVDVVSYGRIETLAIKAATLNIGRQQFEIIQPVSGPIGVYTETVDLDAHILNWHHVAIAVSGPYAEWERLLAEVRAAGDDLAFLGPADPGDNPVLCFCYVDTRKRLGHFTEFLWWHESIKGVIASLPDL